MELVQQTATLQEQLTILRTDLERLQANSSLKEGHLAEENEALKEQLEDARRDLKLNSEALTQTVFSCNNQLTTLKSELAITTTRMENERQTRETLEAEVESTRTRLAGAVKEAELCRAAHTDTEKALLREKEEHQRLKDRLTGYLSQKLAQAESQTNSMENEVHRVTLQLTEKGLLLEVLQREKDQAAARVKELETALQAEKELVSRTGARQEATQERLAQAQSEGMLLRQQLEEAQNKGVAKERAVTDAQERFSDILSKLRSDCEERVQLVEDRNKELASKAADLRDQIYKLEEEKNEREVRLRLCRVSGLPNHCVQTQF
uniref:CCDC144C-like coiled-coil domain-containing protein n=1 Tax=Acanthochromis polyacanthus TaxID=80966 RepID=A0A3Q1GM42_9TELE